MASCSCAPAECKRQYGGVCKAFGDLVTQPTCTCPVNQCLDQKGTRCELNNWPDLFDGWACSCGANTKGPKCKRCGAAEPTHVHTRGGAPVSCEAAACPEPLTRSAQREAGEKHRMRLHQPQREITKDKYAEAILTQMDALRLIMSRRYDPGTVQMIAKEALATLYAVGK